MIVPISVGGEPGEGKAQLRPARHQHREIWFADPTGKHSWDFKGKFLLSCYVHPTGNKHVGHVPFSQPAQSEFLSFGQQNNKEQHIFPRNNTCVWKDWINSPRTSPAQPLSTAAAPYLGWAQTWFGFAFLSIFVLFSRINGNGMCLKHPHNHWASGRAAGEIMARF